LLKSKRFRSEFAIAVSGAAKHTNKKLFIKKKKKLSKSPWLKVGLHG